MAEQNIKKFYRNRVGKEDISWGLDTEIQTRNGQAVSITQVSAKDIPYDDNHNIKELLDETLNGELPVYGNSITLRNDLETEGRIYHKDGDSAYNISIGELANSVKQVDTIADLRAMTKSYNTLWVSGYHTKCDGAFGSNIFEWDSTSVEDDNGGTIIKLDSLTTGRYKLRYYGSANVKWFGAKNSIDNDGSIFINCISKHNNIIFDEKFTFIFDKTNISISHESLYIDFKGTTQTFKNFGGLIGKNCKTATLNISIDADNTYFKGVLKAINLEKFNSEILEIKNVINTQDIDPEQTFILEVSSQTSDNSLNLSCGNIIIEDIHTVCVDYPNARPMTFLGGYGSSGTSTEQMIINIKNIRALNFHSLNSSGEIIGGDSDVFRLFTQNTIVNIDNLYVKNSGKRIFKTQKKAVINVHNANIELDSRFTSLNFNGIFEGQYANSLEPTLFNISNLNINIAEETLTPATFSSNGLGHSIIIDYLKGTNFSSYCIDDSAKIEIKNSNIDGFIINSVLGNSYISNSNITNYRGINSIDSIIRDSTVFLYSSYSGSGFPTLGAVLENVTFDNWNTGIRVAEFKSMKNIKINYTYGSTTKRVFHGIGSELDTIDGLVITTTTGVIYDVPLETDGFTGSMSVKNFRNDLGIQLGYYSSGTWSFWLDNCNGHTVTGVGATVNTASYI